MSCSCQVTFIILSQPISALCASGARVASIQPTPASRGSSGLPSDATRAVSGTASVPASVPEDSRTELGETPSAPGVVRHRGLQHGCGGPCLPASARASRQARATMAQPTARTRAAPPRSAPRSPRAAGPPQPRAGVTVSAAPRASVARVRPRSARASGPPVGARRTQDGWGRGRRRRVGQGCLPDALAHRASSRGPPGDTANCVVRAASERIRSPSTEAGLCDACP